MYSCQYHRIFQFQVCVLLDCFRDLRLIKFGSFRKSHFKTPVKNYFYFQHAKKLFYQLCGIGNINCDF